MRKDLLILDGFDEMVTRKNPAETLANFREIARLATARTKTIVTCRTHYFKDQREANEIFHGKRLGTILLSEIASRPTFSLVEMAPMSDAQISAMVDSRLGSEKGHQTLRAMAVTYNLMAIAKRPVLCDMVVRTLPELLVRGETVNHAELYDVYTSLWTETDDWRSVMTPEGKRQLMQELALMLTAIKADHIHHTALPAGRKEFFKASARHDPVAHDLYDHDTRTCTFLKRDDAGNYSFIHRSFQEFFVAKLVVDIINGGRDSDLSLLKQIELSPEVCSFAEGLLQRSTDLSNLCAELARLDLSNVLFQVAIPALLQELTPRGHVAALVMFVECCFHCRRLPIETDVMKVLAQFVAEDVPVERLATAVGAAKSAASYHAASCARRAVAAPIAWRITKSLAIDALREYAVATTKDSTILSSIWARFAFGFKVLITEPDARLNQWTIAAGPPLPGVLPRANAAMASEGDDRNVLSQ